MGILGFIAIIFRSICAWTLIFIYCLFRAALVPYGSSQARSPIRAVAASLCHSHSNTVSEQCLRSVPHLMAMLDPLTQSEARDPTHILMDTSRVTTEPQWELLETFYNKAGKKIHSLGLMTNFGYANFGNINWEVIQKKIHRL